MHLLTKKYGCIIADPPWPERGGGKIKRGADKHYPLMSVKDICALPVEALALPNSHLYLWVTNNYLRAGFEVLDAWGFRYVTKITWEKDRPGLGQYFRGTTEDCLFAVRGQPGYQVLPNGRRAQGVTGFRTLEGSEPDEGTWFSAPRTEHSAKPPRIHEWAELVSPGPYIELFARTLRPGWTAWGNEVDPLS